MSENVNQNKGRSGNTPANQSTPKDWKKDTDSPIERAKMPYNLFLWSKIGLMVGVISNTAMLFYSFGVMENNKSLFDMGIFVMSYMPHLIMAVALSVVSVAQREER